MKARIPCGTGIVFYETHMKEPKSMNQEKLTNIQKHLLEQLPEEQRIKILAGYPAAIIDLETSSTLCEFNIRNIHIPKYALESLARTLLPSIQDFYSNEENRKEFEKWQEEQKKK